MQFMIKGYVGASFYPVADIQQMRHAWKDVRGGDHPATIQFKDGREIHVDDADINRVVRQTTPIVPAQPGFDLLSFGYMPGEDDGGPWVHREAIIGWREGRYGGLEPVIVDYDFDEMADHHAIRQPDGQIQVGERWFKDEQAWADHMKAAADDDHARLQQARAAKDVGGASGSPA